MATLISSHVKDKNGIFTVRDKDIFLLKGKILVFHQYLYNKYIYVVVRERLTLMHLLHP